jgi:radical SAM protein with 4Fe4S-binding SPASM domain
MLRISSLLKDAYHPCPPGSGRRKPGWVVIWNLTNRCNLSCHHCYADANARRSPEELSTREAQAVIDELATIDLSVLILSGGEPILRKDLYELSDYARERGISCALSTNGTLIDEAQVEKILECGIGYVGISLDGSQEKHDAFRGRRGAYDASLRAIRLCRDAGIKVGLRVSLTTYTASELPVVTDLFEREGLGKLYVSHMNYSSSAMRPLALEPPETREMMCFLIAKAKEYLGKESFRREIVTGNNDADAPFLFLRVEKEDPPAAEKMYHVLMQTRGKGSGLQLANIDSWGNVHPDPFCKEITLGNARQRPFSQVLAESQGHWLMSLPSRKEGFHGRCGGCRFADSLCGGGSRARAFAQSSDWRGSDPSCYLSDEEISKN